MLLIGKTPSVFKVSTMGFEDFGDGSPSLFHLLCAMHLHHNMMLPPPCLTVGTMFSGPKVLPNVLLVIVAN